MKDPQEAHLIEQGLDPFWLAKAPFVRVGDRVNQTKVRFRIEAHALTIDSWPHTCSDGSIQ
jgi:hypothetical protein